MKTTTVEPSQKKKQRTKKKKKKKKKGRKITEGKSTRKWLREKKGQQSSL